MVADHELPLPCSIILRSPLLVSQHLVCVQNAAELLIGLPLLNLRVVSHSIRVVLHATRTVVKHQHNQADAAVKPTLSASRRKARFTSSVVAVFSCPPRPSTAYSDSVPSLPTVVV